SSLLRYGKDQLVGLIATLAADGVAAWLKSKYPSLNDDSWQITTTKLWVKIGITDAGTAYLTGGNPCPVIASTAQVAIGEIIQSIGETMSVLANTQAGYQSWQQQINNALKMASSLEGTDPVTAQKFRDTAAQSQKDLILQMKADYN